MNKYHTVVNEYRQISQVVLIYCCCDRYDVITLNSSLKLEYDLLEEQYSVALSLAEWGRQRYLLATSVMEQRANHCVNCLNVMVESQKPMSSVASDSL